MDWISTLVGAAIGFVSSIGVIIAQRIIDRAGNLELYTKVVYNRSLGSGTWGFHKNANGIVLNVPLWIEIQNLSNSTRILRDINLVLVSKGKEVATMIKAIEWIPKAKGHIYMQMKEAIHFRFVVVRLEKSIVISCSKQVPKVHLLMNYYYVTMMKRIVLISFL